MDGLAIWNNWLVLAWIAPVAWASSGIIDVLIIEQRIYRDPNQATAISAMVVALPFLVIAIPNLNLAGLEASAILLALLGGLCYFLMLLFYYKAMFTANDVAHAETFLNLEVLFIPLLAFLFLGEQLSVANYLGVGLAAFGVVILNSTAGRYFGNHVRLTRYLLASVLASSCGLVIQDEVFVRIGYWNGITGYAFGMLLGVLLLAWYRGPLNIHTTFIRHSKPILIAELFTLLATFTGLRSVDLSPSVSLVAVIESTRPVLIMAVCLLSWGLLRRAQLCRAEVVQALRNQFDAAPAKLLANGLIIGGVYIISLSATQA